MGRSDKRKSYVFGQVRQVAASEYGNDTAITRSVKELSNARGNMAALVFGQARSAFLGAARPLSHSLWKGLFVRGSRAKKVPAYTSRRQSISCILVPRSFLAFSLRASLVSEGFVEQLLRFRPWAGLTVSPPEFRATARKFTKLLLRFSVFKCS